MSGLFSPDPFPTMGEIWACAIHPWDCGPACDAGVFALSCYVGFAAVVVAGGVVAWIAWDAVWWVRRKFRGGATDPAISDAPRGTQSG